MRTSGPTQVEFDTARERRAWTYGRNRAVENCDRYGTSNPESLAIASGLSIVEDDWEGLDDLVLLGTYRDGTITLYREQIRDVADASGVPEYQLVEGTLAHELGHHLVDVSEIESQRTLRWYNLVESLLDVNRHAKAVHEAAANGFCFELLERRFETSRPFETPEILISPSL